MTQSSLTLSHNLCGREADGVPVALCATGGPMRLHGPIQEILYALALLSMFWWTVSARAYMRHPDQNLRGDAENQ